MEKHQKNANYLGKWSRILRNWRTPLPTIRLCCKCEEMVQCTILEGNALRPRNNRARKNQMCGKAMEMRGPMAARSEAELRSDVDRLVILRIIGQRGQAIAL